MKTIEIAVLILILFGFLEIVYNQLIKGPLVVYHVSKLEGCLSTEKSFLSLVVTSINQCAEECFLRPQCMAVEYERRFQICELLEFARTETVPRSGQKNDCVYLTRSEMTVQTQLPSVCNECVSGETCDLELLQCVKSECKPLNIINGDVFGNINSNGSRVKYKCHPGFARAQIEGIVTCIDGMWRPTPTCIDINECVSSPCMNGATCVDGINYYACKCAPGYDGTNCEIDINECASSPCMNGATCANGINNYACKCAPGYAGTNCELDINECASSPCMNGATCLNGINKYACKCAPGYAGTNCLTNINECASSPCINGATCADGINYYACKCAPGYAGTNCQIVLPNVAFGKPTHMSSQWKQSLFGSELAVDGITNQNLDGGSCFHTNTEYRPWWQVDLEAVYDIYIVRLYNRIDACGDRASNVILELLLGKTPETLVATQYKEGQIDDVHDFKFGAGNLARYVKLTLGAKNYFHLCEVQIFGIVRMY